MNKNSSSSKSEVVVRAKKEIREGESRAKGMGAVSHRVVREVISDRQHLSRNLNSSEGLSHAGVREIRLKAERRTHPKARRWEFLRSTRG